MCVGWRDISHKCVGYLRNTQAKTPVYWWTECMHFVNGIAYVLYSTNVAALSAYVMAFNVYLKTTCATLDGAVLK